MRHLICEKRQDIIYNVSIVALHIYFVAIRGDYSMRVYTVSFFGHRVIENPLQVEQRLDAIIRQLLREQEYVEFLVGRDGEFDQLASSCIRRCQRELRSDNSTHTWVLPYLTAGFRNDEEAYQAYYDSIEICEASAGSHFKTAYQTRNRSMVDRSNLVVFCIQHRSGGAWQTLRYAEKTGTPHLNLNS